MRKIILTLFIFSVAIGIFAPISFSLTAQQIAMQTNVANAVEQNLSDAGVNEVASAGTCLDFTKFDMGWCLAKLFYFVPFVVGGKILDMSATFMDNTASMTLSSKLFQSDFIGTAWGILRDFANMFFIFILLYIAINMILGQESGGKKMVVSVVVIALVINFSLFITEAVIDFSNVTALVFYNQLGATNSTGGTVDAKNINGNLGNDATGTNAVTIKKEDLVQPKSIGLALASHFRPQIFANPTFWSGVVGDGKSASPVLLIEIAMGVLYIAVGYSFFVAAISFIGRMVELWILIIASPFAFISYIVPNLKGVKNYGWTDWWKKLFEVSFAAPIYFFFLLIIGILMQSMFGKPPKVDGADWMTTLLGQVILPAIMIYSLIIKATDYVKKASGEIGEKMGSMAGQAFSTVGKGALSLAGGAAMGAGAWAGARTFGKMGEKFKDTKVGQWAEKNKTGNGIAGFAARRMKDVASKAQTSSFDIRHSKLGGALQSATGMSFGSYGALSAERSAGGAKNRLAWKEGAGERFKEKYGKDEKLEADISHAKEHKEGEVVTAKKKLADKEEILVIIKEEADTLRDEIKTKQAEQIVAKNLGTPAGDAEAARLGGEINTLKSSTRFTNAMTREKNAKDDVKEAQGKVANLTTKNQYSEIKDANGNITERRFKEDIKDANGTIIHQKDSVMEPTPDNLLKYSGTESLEKFGKNTENSKMNEFMANKAFDRFKGKREGDEQIQYNKDGTAKVDNEGKVIKIEMKKDALGNVTNVKINKNSELRTINKVKEVVKDVAAGAIVGAGMAGLGGAVHVASGATSALGYAHGATSFVGKGAQLVLNSAIGITKGVGVATHAITSAPVINIALKTAVPIATGYNAVKSAGKTDSTATSAAMKNMTGDHPHGKGVAVAHTKTQEISNGMWSMFGKMGGEIFKKSSNSHSTPAAHPPKKAGGGGDAHAHGH